MTNNNEMVLRQLEAIGGMSLYTKDMVEMMSTELSATKRENAQLVSLLGEYRTELVELKSEMQVLSGAVGRLASGGGTVAAQIKSAEEISERNDILNGVIAKLARAMNGVGDRKLILGTKMTHAGFEVYRTISDSVDNITEATGNSREKYTHYSRMNMFYKQNGLAVPKGSGKFSAHFNGKPYRTRWADIIRQGKAVEYMNHLIEVAESEMK